MDHFKLLFKIKTLKGLCSVGMLVEIEAFPLLCQPQVHWNLIYVSILCVQSAKSFS